MVLSKGEIHKFTARVEVAEGNKKKSDEKSIEYYVAASSKQQDQEYLFKLYKQQATERLEKATNAVKELASLGIENSDLTTQLLDATKKLSETTTTEEASEAEETARDVIKECDARRTAYQTQTDIIDKCKANQAKIKQLIIDYYNANGNLPNSISDVAGLPSCPSGGQYTYTAPSTDPSTLSVSCSVHGSL